ncbi:MAG: ABC transporter ATP-binding protein, partial [Waterburya sp.]
PEAKIGEILKVPFPHPRDRKKILKSQEYYDLRNQALNFLEQYQ